MIAASALPRTAIPAPGVCSAVELCRAIRGAAAGADALARLALDRVLRHDTERGVAEVQAGVSWAALAPLTGNPFLQGTVGDCAMQNSPGVDGRPMVEHVRALTLATADGRLHHVSRERSPELFRLAMGGMGAFGPFYSLTLDLSSLTRASSAAVSPALLDLRTASSGGPRHAVELLLPPERAHALADLAREALAARRCELVLMRARRALAEDVTFLRWARRDYVALRLEFAVRATLGASLAGAQLRRRLLDLAIEAGGSVMPASLPAASKAQAEACYPMLPAFLAEARRFDPEVRIGGAWLRDVARIWRGELCHSRFGG